MNYAKGFIERLKEAMPTESIHPEHSANWKKIFENLKIIFEKDLQILRITNIESRLGEMMLASLLEKQVMLQIVRLTATESGWTMEIQIRDSPLGSLYGVRTLMLLFICQAKWIAEKLVAEEDKKIDELYLSLMRGFSNDNIISSN